MARIRKFFRDSTASARKHPTEVDCGHKVVVVEGARFLQLNTYGSEQRHIPGKVSQTIQLDARRAKELGRLIDTSFNGK